MLCQDCNKREATVQITQIVNNEKLSLHLCKECAAARGFHSHPLEDVPFPLAEILSGLSGKPVTPGQKLEHENITCRTCGLSFGAFSKQGRFGCGDCYRTFRPVLEQLMRKIHDGKSLHLGRGPTSRPAEPGTETPIPAKEEERLEDQLRKAIESEDFERAAEIRDKLKSMRQS